jgi:redox-sensitive bicupin YhaK (pirin superfamily)
MNTTIPALQIRRSEDRGHNERGWLDSFHTFSFSDYYDPKWMGYGPLRVINEDRVVPTAGFPPHSHQNMEILSYVLDGGLKHRDSSGGGGVIRHGELQVMSAGRGITHSEMNASYDESVHFLQIWIEPDTLGLPPGYQQQPLDTAALQEGFALVAAHPRENAPFAIHQDARLSIAWPAAGKTLALPLREGRKHYLHVARGEIALDGETLKAGDAALIETATPRALTATTDAELLLFDLA